MSLSESNTICTLKGPNIFDLTCVLRKSKIVLFGRLKRTKQSFTGKIMYTEDFIANIHGVLYHETLPKGHKKIDVKVFEEKKKTRQTERQNTTVVTLELKLDEENHCIYAKVEDIISSGTSITTHDKQQSELISKFDPDFKPFHLTEPPDSYIKQRDEEYKVKRT